MVSPASYISADQQHFKTRVTEIQELQGLDSPRAARGPAAPATPGSSLTKQNLMSTQTYGIIIGPSTRSPETQSLSSSEFEAICDFFPVLWLTFLASCWGTSLSGEVAKERNFYLIVS